MDLVSRITEVITAIGVAIKGKQDNLVSGTNIKTINSQSLLGSGNIVISGGGGGGVQNVYIQDTQPTIATGGKALWIDITGGNLNFWIVTGD